MTYTVHYGNNNIKCGVCNIDSVNQNNLIYKLGCVHLFILCFSL